MKTYQVFVTPEAKRQMRRHLSYIETKLQNHQAAESVYQDFLAVGKKLAVIAGTVKEPEDEELIHRKLKRINFERHQYFMLFTIVGDKVSITNVFHFRENHLAKLK